MESPDGTYMSHYGAPVGCPGAPCGAQAGPVFRRDHFRLRWQQADPEIAVPE